MEFYNGNEWRQFTYISDIQNSPSGRGRGVMGGGNPGSDNNAIIDISLQVINIRKFNKFW